MQFKSKAEYFVHILSEVLYSTGAHKERKCVSAVAFAAASRAAAVLEQL